MTPRLLVILLNYRTAGMAIRSAQAVLTALDGLRADLVIVDNDSRDGSYERLAEAVTQEPWATGKPIRVIASGYNGGFGAGNNVGMRARMADGGAPDFVYILNSDAFPAPDAVRKLQDHLLAHPEAGMAGSFLQGEDGEAHMTAFRFPSVWSELEIAARTGPVSRLLASRKVPIDLPDSTCCVDWTAGASLMMRQEMLDRIGLFDETFFLYFEETDLCLRAARAGYETHYVRDSVVTHIGSVSTGMKRRERVPGFWLDSRWHYFSKNHGRGYAVLATLSHALGGGIWRARMLLQRKPPADPPRFLRDMIRHDFNAAFRRLPPVRQAGLPRQATAAETGLEGTR